MNSEDLEDLIQHWHDKGEQDYWDDNWDPPDKAMIWELIEGNDEVEIAVSQAYQAGWRNARSQDR